MNEESCRELPKSEPFQVFQINMDSILHLLNGIAGDWEQLNAGPVDDVQKVLDALLSRVSEIGVAAAGAHLEDALKQIQKVHERVQVLTKVQPFVFDWMLVMMVSFAEVYLEEVLLLLVARNPKWMRRQRLAIPYADLMDAMEAGSLPELIKNMQFCWAKKILSERPKEWIRLLEKFGAKGYRAGLADEMTTVWETRHQIVHSKRTLRLMGHSRKNFEIGSDVILRFVESTDAFVMDFENARNVTRMS